MLSWFAILVQAGVLGFSYKLSHQNLILLDTLRHPVCLLVWLLLRSLLFGAWQLPERRAWPQEGVEVRAAAWHRMKLRSSMDCNHCTTHLKTMYVARAEYRYEATKQNACANLTFSWRKVRAWHSQPPASCVARPLLLRTHFRGTSWRHPEFLADIVLSDPLWGLVSWLSLAASWVPCWWWWSLPRVGPGDFQCLQLGLP